MNIRLMIDGSDYSDKIVERNFMIHYQTEGNYNEPTSSVANFVLHNDVGLQDYFLISDPYAIVNPGLVEIWDSTDLPNVLLFKGYINREKAPEDLSTKDLEIEVIGLEQSKGQSFSKYDITQLYYELGDDTLQRGGRTTTKRYSTYSYLSIEDFINTIFKDLGLFCIIDIPNSASFKYKYNEDKYGLITGVRHCRLTSNIRGGMRTMTSTNAPYNKKIGSDILMAIRPYSNKEITKEDDASYDVLLKDWAALTGCIYSYIATAGTWYFVPRDYEFNPVYVSRITHFEDIIIDDKPTIHYSQVPNGIKIDLTDILLGIKREIGIPVGVTWKYGAGANSGDQVIIEEGIAGADYISIHNADHKFRFGGTITPALPIYNTLGLKLNDDLISYLEPGDLQGGDSVKDLLDAVRDNYETVFAKDRAEEVKASGMYTAPKRIYYRDQWINVYDIEIDVIEQTSTFRFQYQ